MQDKQADQFVNDWEPTWLQVEGSRLVAAVVICLVVAIVMTFWVAVAMFIGYLLAAVLHLGWRRSDG